MFPRCWSPALELTGCWEGPGPGEKMVTSRTRPATKYSPELLPPVSVPAVSRSSPSPLQGTFQYQQMCLAQAFMRLVLFTLCPGAPANSRVSVFFSPVKLQLSASAGLQSQISWGLLLPFSDPQAGEPDVGLRTSTPVGGPQVLIVFYFVGCPPAGI